MADIERLSKLLDGFIGVPMRAQPRPLPDAIRALYIGGHRDHLEAVFVGLQNLVGFTVKFNEVYWKIISGTIAPNSTTIKLLMVQVPLEGKYLERFIGSVSLEIDEGEEEDLEWKEMATDMDLYLHTFFGVGDWHTKYTSDYKYYTA